MNESGYWDSVRRAFKRSRASTAWKVQDAYRSGLPDADVIVMGRVAKLELKYAEAWPKRKGALRTRLKPSQRRHLLEWHEAGGNAFVLLGVGKTNYVLHPLDLPESGKFYEADVVGAAVLETDRLADVVEWVSHGCPSHES